jgi:hypothetical protein
VIEHHCGNANDACGPVGKDSTETFGAGLYEAAELAELPAEAVAGSIGCANPVALARLERGEDILDLGPAEASMCCSRLAEWDPRAAPMGWT